MPQAMRIHRTGGPEVLQWETFELPAPGEGEVRVRHRAIGLNYIDTYHRTGLYPIPLPAILGREAAGEVVDCGAGVSGFRKGKRVAHVLATGSYATEVNVPAGRLIRIPDDLDDERVAAMLLKGLTAHYLLRRTYEVRRGDTVLIHAAAGGVGLIACQWAKHLGAMVVGTVGSAEKAELARGHGCDHPVLYRESSFRDKVLEVTDGRGVPVVYDSVGQATFDQSLDCLAPRGLLVSFGQSSGPVPPFDTGRLAAGGSLFLTRPSLATYIASADELRENSTELFDVVRGGAVRVEVGHRYALREAAQAHADLEARKTTGSTVLIP